MSITILLLSGFVFLLFVLIKKGSIIQYINRESLVMNKLKASEWFGNKWISGIILFLANARLFIAAVATIFLVGMLEIPYLHLVVMFLAIIASFYMWMSFKMADPKERKGQLIMGLVGSSFYFLLLILFIYMLITLEPATPEHDTFMAFVGLIFASIVAFTAGTSCFLITGVIKVKTN